MKLIVELISFSFIITVFPALFSSLPLNINRQKLAEMEAVLERRKFLLIFAFFREKTELNTFLLCF